MVLQRIYERRLDLLVTVAVHSLRKLLTMSVVHRSNGLLQIYRSFSGSGTGSSVHVGEIDAGCPGTLSAPEEFDFSRHSSCPPKRLWCALAAVGSVTKNCLV